MNNTKKWEYLVCCESGNMDLLKEVHVQVKTIPSDIKQEGLEIACSCGNNEIVQYILEKMDEGDLDKETCVRIATKKAHMNVVTSLLADSFKFNPHI
jgi:hypothetical protein